VLRDCLSRQPKLMLHSQTTAQFEKGLAIPLNQFVKNRSTRRSSDCLEHITHTCDDRQVVTCLSSGGTFAEAIRRFWAVYGQTGSQTVAGDFTSLRSLFPKATVDECEGDFTPNMS
jgi:hypothetical protein